LQLKTKIVSCHTGKSKPVKQEVNGTVILPPLVFSGLTYNKHTIVNFQQDVVASMHHGPNLFAQPFWGNSAVLSRRI